MMTPPREVLNKFIVFEGIDGSGSSTQAVQLSKRLTASQIPVKVTAEPTDGPVGNLIRLILRGRLEAGATQAETDGLLAHLFAADRFDHLNNKNNGIRKALREGRFVISERYFFSSLVYQQSELAQHLNCFFPLPELIFYSSCSIETSLKRLSLRSQKEFYETREKLEEVKLRYESVLKDYQDRVVILNTENSLTEVSEQVWNTMTTRYGSDLQVL